MTTAVSAAGNLISAKMLLASPQRKRAEVEGILLSLAFVEAKLIDLSATSMPMEFLKRGERAQMEGCKYAGV